MNTVSEIEYVLQTTINALPPLLLAGLGGMITSKIQILNLGLEGMMLVGAFAAVVTNVFTGSPLMGLLVAILVSSAIGVIFAFLNLKFKVDNVIVSVGINLFAIAVTRYMLTTLFGVSGAFSSDKIGKLPVVHLAFLEQIPILNVFSRPVSYTHLDVYKRQLIHRIPVRRLCSGQAVALRGEIVALAVHPAPAVL